MFRRQLVLRATVCKNQTKSEICGKAQIFYCALILDLSLLW